MFAARTPRRPRRRWPARAREVATPGVPAVRLETPGPARQLVVPRATKLDLEAFVPARDPYDQLEWDEKLLLHSWLLDLGVLLCEPSIRFDGMGGECIWGCACWVVVPHAAIRGEARRSTAEAAAVGVVRRRSGAG